MQRDLVKFMTHLSKEPKAEEAQVERTVRTLIKKYQNHSISTIAINDHREMNFVFVSKNIDRLLGYPHKEVVKNKLVLSNEIIHPQDINRSALLFEDIFKFYFSLPLDERLNYKFCNEVRLKSKSGSYVWLLHEFEVVKFDFLGKPLVSLSQVKDITAIKEDETQNLWIGKYFRDGNYRIELSKKYHCHPVSLNLSKRELEILKLLSSGFCSKEIAERLHISLHTVNTHRQNMLRKTNSRNVCELIKYSLARGAI